MHMKAYDTYGIYRSYKMRCNNSIIFNEERSKYLTKVEEKVSCAVYGD